MVPRALLIVIILAAVFAGANALQNPYWPLAVGNQWNYFNKYINATMTITIKPSPPSFGCVENPYWAWFTKSNESNYWAPGYPVNLNWFLKVNEDGVLHALGHCPTLIANDSVAFADTNDYISLDPRYPPYYLIPPPNKFYPGMHIMYDQSYPYAPNLNFTCMPVNMGAVNPWNVTFTKSWVDTPAFQGPALVMYVNEGHGGWIEKWYYALNIGVVRIEALVGGYVPFDPPVVNDLVSYTLWPFNN